ncbi:MAG: Smr/MutS family protein [Novosphingobium sp.]
MTAPYGLTPEEAALWERVAATITPLHPPRQKAIPPKAMAAKPAPEATATRRIRGRIPPPLPAPAAVSAPLARPLERHGLDSSWERKLARGAIAPDVTIDLHGLGLDAAHARLNGGIAQALAMGARVMLLIAGKHRPSDEHDLRGSRRGAIRAKLLDWLAHSPHAGRIAAVRPAQPRHGGAGAVYIVLRKAR